MDYRNLFGAAAIILSCAVLIQSLNSANAFPQGPNVSMGGNPIEQTILNCNGNESWTNNTSSPYIITDLVVYAPSYTINLYIDNNLIVKHYGITEISMNSGIKVSPGQVLTCDGQTGRYFTISGYYSY